MSPRQLLLSLNSLTLFHDARVITVEDKMAKPEEKKLRQVASNAKKSQMALLAGAVKRKR